LTDFAKSIQKAVETAQDEVRHGQEARLRRLLDVDGEGRVNAISWSTDAPDGSGLRGELPLLTVRGADMMQIAELSLEVDCTVERGRSGEADDLYLIPQNRTDPPAEGTHRLCVTVEGSEKPGARVTLDGHHLKALPPRGRTATGHEAEPDAPDAVLDLPPASDPRQGHEDS
jgi:hypothetical protein